MHLDRPLLPPKGRNWRRGLLGAERKIGLIVNGFAQFSALVSAASFLGFLGLCYRLGWSFTTMAFGVGSTLGFVLSMLIASGPLRRYSEIKGKFTLTNFFSDRYGTPTALATSTLGRFGGLITPEFGPRVRLCKVLTDLPLKPTSPIDFGVTEFCEVCQKCAEYCPAQAILYGKRTHKARASSTNPGLLKWPLDGEKCFRYWYKNGAKTDRGMYHIDCYQCVNVCPFNKRPGLGHNMVRWFVRKFPSLNRLWLFGDDLFYKPLYRTGKYKKALNRNLTPKEDQP